MCERCPAASAVLSDEQLLMLEIAAAVVVERPASLAEQDLEQLAGAATLVHRHGRGAPITPAQWAAIHKTVRRVFAAGGGRMARLLAA